MKKYVLLMSALSMLLWFSGCALEGEDEDKDEETDTTIAVTSVTLDKTSFSCYVGQPAVNLIATVVPSDATTKTITWTSDSPSIAKVTYSNVVGTATVYAVSPGEAIITVSCGEKSATCTVTVKKSTLTLDSEDRIIMKDNIFQLKTSISPTDSDQTITWSSNDTSIASVSSVGYVTGVGPGQTYITATAQDGSKASVVITVLPCETLTETGTFISGVLTTSTYSKQCYYKFYASAGVTYKFYLKDRKYSSSYTGWVQSTVFSDEQLTDSSRLTDYVYWTSTGTATLLYTFTSAVSQYVYIYVGPYNDDTSYSGSFAIQVAH